MFNFKNLISKYSKGQVVAIIESEGYYDQDQAGKYIEGEKKALVLKPAAIVPLSKDDLRFDKGGFYSSDNRKLYCYERLEEGVYIYNVQEDNIKARYRIMAKADYSDYDNGLFIYLLESADLYGYNPTEFRYIQDVGSVKTYDLGANRDDRET